MNQNRFKKRKEKSKMRTVRIVFKKKKGGKRNPNKTMKKIKKMTRKQVKKELRRNRIDSHRNTPTSILKDILYYKKAENINIIKGRKF